jgi:hypothetical protein
MWNGGRRAGTDTNVSHRVVRKRQTCRSMLIAKAQPAISVRFTSG